MPLFSCSFLSCIQEFEDANCDLLLSNQIQLQVCGHLARDSGLIVSHDILKGISVRLNFAVMVLGSYNFSILKCWLFKILRETDGCWGISFNQRPLRCWTGLGLSLGTKTMCASSWLLHLILVLCSFREL